MLEKPIVVYLDTQDYIRLFNEDQNSPAHQTLEKLLEFRDQGKIAIGFSWAIMLEFVTKPTDEYREERVRRGKLVKDICGPNAFPFVTELRHGARFPNSGHWMSGKGGKTLSAKKFRQWMFQQYLDLLSNKGTLNRSELRRLKRPQAMNDLLRKSTSTWGTKIEDFKGIPISKEFVESGITNRFIKGRCSDAEFEYQLNKWFSDPAEYSRIYYDYGNKPNMLSEHFGTSIQKFETLITNLQDYNKRFDELESQRTIVRQGLRELGISKRSIRELTRPKVKRQTLTLDDALKTIADAYGNERVAHIPHYIEKAQKASYSFKASDVIDIMQMMYVCECDLFRCDKAMSDLFRDYTPFKGKIVKRFEDLPAKIEAKINKLAC